MGAGKLSPFPVKMTLGELSLYDSNPLLLIETQRNKFCFKYKVVF